MKMMTAVFTALALTLGATSLLAQAGQTPSLRPYWHVFIAYTLVWLLVAGWVISIFRRLGRLDQRFGGDDD